MEVPGDETVRSLYAVAAEDLSCSVEHCNIHSCTVDSTNYMVLPDFLLRCTTNIHALQFRRDINVLNPLVGDSYFVCNDALAANTSVQPPEVVRVSLIYVGRPWTLHEFYLPIITAIIPKY
jgi:hypothetical protein